MPIKRVPCLGKFYCQQVPSKWATNPYSIGFSIPTSTDSMMHFGRKLMNSWFYALCMVLVFLHWGGQRTKEGINRANSFMQIFWCSQYFNLADHYLKFCCEAPLCGGAAAGQNAAAARQLSEFLSDVWPANWTVRAASPIINKSISSSQLSSLNNDPILIGLSAGKEKNCKQGFTPCGQLKSVKLGGLPAIGQS